MKPPLGQAPVDDQILNVHVKILVVLPDVKNRFDVALLLTVIDFVPTILDIVLLVDDLEYFIHL